MQYNLNDTEIIAPNFKRRLSGVTSSIIQLLPQQRAQNIKISALGFGLPKNLPFISFWALKDLWKKPKNRPFYIIHARRHTEMIFGIILRDWLKAKVKIIFTAAAERKQKKFTYFLMSRMDRLVAVTPKISKLLKSPNIIIQHGIDTNRFCPGSSELQIEGKYIIGCAGRIRHSKGTDIFIDSMIEMLPQFKEWKAIFAGRITPENKLYADKIFSKIKKAGLEDRIIYIGELSNQGGRQDINQFYKKLNLYVAPSRNEGFGLTTLEAMASEVPIIANDAGIYGKIISKESGEVIEKMDAQKLTQVLRKFFANPEILKSKAVHARQYIMKNYALATEATALGQLYEDVFQKCR